jgi:hypothetical protein
VIPTDLKTLAKMTGIEHREIKRHWPHIEHFFIKTKNGDYMYSPEIKNAVDEYRARGDKARNDGRRGGNTSAAIRKQKATPP